MITCNIFRARAPPPPTALPCSPLFYRWYFYSQCRNISGFRFFYLVIIQYDEETGESIILGHRTSGTLPSVFQYIYNYYRSADCHVTCNKRSHPPHVINLAFPWCAASWTKSNLKSPARRWSRNGYLASLLTCSGSDRESGELCAT